MHIFQRLRLHIFGPKRLAPGAWQVADASWGVVHQYGIAKLCALCEFDRAEQQAMKSIARYACLETATASALALALHDLACVFQVQAKFEEAVSARERFRHLARKVVEHKFPGILDYCERLLNAAGDQWPGRPRNEWHPALYELARAEECLATVYEGTRRLDDALASCEYAVAVWSEVGHLDKVEHNLAELRRLRRMAATLQNPPEPTVA